MLTASTAPPLLRLPRIIKQFIVATVDGSLCIVTVWFAFYLRLGEFMPLSGSLLWTAGLSIALALPLFVVFGLYQAIFRYTGLPTILAVGKACFVYGLLFSTICTAVGISGVPRTIGLMQPILLLLAISATRAAARFLLGGTYQNRTKLNSLPRALIYGAGNAGRQLAVALANNLEMRVVGFLDDDEKLHGHMLNGLRVYSPTDLNGLVESLAVTTVLLALPSASRKRRNEILDTMQHAHVSIRTLPSITDIAQGKVTTSDICELDLDDLLGREPVTPDPNLLARNITGKTVLVTGAGGSIGSELCRQILIANPTTLLLVEQSEFALYSIHQELLERNVEAGPQLIPLLASVCNEDRIREIMTTWRPSTVYHAAAYKHVPLVEHNPIEGVRNNVIGTQTVASVAMQEGVSDFVLISTDKAVRPTNIMGASKRLAEMVLQAMATEAVNTRFCMVRFGNVLGSSGSVVPKFRRQIRDGGPITLTHPDITRYFMTIPEAAQLVIQAGAMANGGDVFVLDMGEPVRIQDLAVRMIELSGLTVRDSRHEDGDVAIEIAGLRPGEKLFEELLIGDNPERTQHPRIMKAHEAFIRPSVLDNELMQLSNALKLNDVNLVCTILKRLVSGYQPADHLVDWVHLERSSRKNGPLGIAPQNTDNLQQ